MTTNNFTVYVWLVSVDKASLDILMTTTIILLTSNTYRIKNSGTVGPEVKGSMLL